LISLELEVTAEDIGGNRGAKVTNVAVVPDSWTTVIESNFTFSASGEILLFDRRECF
jgi:hypothetical protein